MIKVRYKVFNTKLEIEIYITLLFFIIVYFIPKAIKK